MDISGTHKSSPQEEHKSDQSNIYDHQFNRTNSSAINKVLKTKINDFIIFWLKERPTGM